MLPRYAGFVSGLYLAPGAARLYAKGKNYYCSAQGEQTVVVVDAKTLKEVAQVKLEVELDALVLVPKHHFLYAESP